MREFRLIPTVAIAILSWITLTAVSFAQTSAVDSSKSSSPWPSSKDRSLREGNKLPWTLQLSAGPGYFLPVGNYFDGIDAGLSGHFALAIAVSKDFAIRAPISFGSSGTNLQGVDFTPFRGSIGVLFHSRLSRNPANLGEFYGYWGLGVMSVAFSVDGNSPYVYQGDQNRFLSDFSVGLNLQVSKSILLDLAADLPIVYLESVNSSYATAFLLTLRTGLVLNIHTGNNK